MPVPARSLTSVLCLLTLGAGAAHGQLTVTGSDETVGALRAHNSWFKDRTVPLGLKFRHQDGALSYAMGSGAAWLDLENDGDEDLVLLSAQGPGAVFRNDGGTFVDVYDTSGILPPHGNDPIGVIAADYDQDGLTDLYFSNTRENQLFRNLGGTFVDVAVALGVDGGEAWSSCASWADFDLDGDLDLYVGNYIRQLSFPYHFGEPNFLFENRGPGASPQFVDVAPVLGVDNDGVFGPTVTGEGLFYESPEGERTAGCTLSICTLDWDEDGDPDLGVGNDFGLFILPNAMYRNDQAGAGMAFTDVSTAYGFDTRPHYNMGIVPCDYDHDGDWDYYKSNLGDNVLLRNDDGVLVDATYTAGPLSGLSEDGTQLLSSWGMIFDDLDNDGWEDIVVANGLIPAATFIDNANRSPNDLWRNRGDGTFEEIQDFTSGLSDRGPGRGLARVDLNSDGLLDFYLQNNGADYVAFPQDISRFYLNQGPKAVGHWLELDVRGRFSNGEGFGARLDAEVGTEILKRQVLCDPVFISSSSRMVHFGLGPAAEVDRLTVHWPSGIVQTWIDVPANQRVQLLEPAATVDAIAPIQAAAGILTLAADLTNHDTIGQTVDVTFRLVSTVDGTEVLSKVTSVAIAAGQAQAVQVQEVLAPAVYAALQGTQVELQVSAGAGGGLDSDLDVQILP